MKEYNVIYRTRGVKNLNLLLNTRVNDFSRFEFPKHSLLHYFNLDESGNGPDESLFYIAQQKRRILTENIVNYVTLEGIKPLDTPIYLPGTINNKIRSYFFQHKRFRLFKEPYINNKDENVLELVNYSFIPSLYRYYEKQLTDFYKFYNLFLTVILTIKRIGEVSNVNQFLFIKVPTVIPGLTDFRKYDKVNHLTLEIFNSPELLIIRDMFKYIAGHTEENIFSNLSKESLKNLTFVVYYGNKYYMLNAYYLYSFNKDNEDGLSLNYKTKSEMLSKIFLNSLINLQSNGIIEVNPEDDNNDEGDDKEEEVIDETATDTDLTSDNTSGNRITAPTSIKTDKIKYLSDSELEKDVNTDLDDINNSIKLMEENLNALDKKSKLRTIDLNTDYEKLLASIEKEKSAHEDLSKKLDDYSLYKVLTGSEVKSLQEKLNNFTNLSNPYDPNSKLINSIQITKDELEIDPYKETLVGNNSIIDKTMLRSTLVDFDKQYLEKTYHKDILNAVTNIQRAGIIIDSYKIEPTYSISGNYETHIVKVHPVDGKPSTLYFKLPMVDENGVFVVNQTKYRSRKMRGDLPIKKIKKDIVALTSYYNKVFIERSQKKANDLSDYLFKYIFKYGIQINDPSVVNISNVKMNDVFDNYFPSSRLYSALATNFSNFTIDNLNFNLNHKVLEKDFNAKTFKDKYPCGTKGNDLIYLDNNDNVLLYKDNKFEVLGNFYSLLNIDENKLPLEYNCIKIFTKDIPLALLLGYYVGIDNIIRLLNVDHNFIDLKETYDTNKYFKIEFKDKVLLVDKKDKKSIGILAGFLDYDTSKYKYSEFNKQNVYFNLLGDMKLNTIYLKEMDQLRDLFIDPITLELLKDNNEPTTWIGLILKANEMLIDDNHPDDLDMRYMRIKGYERFAGIVYNNLTKAIRLYKLKNNNGQAKIDLNPNEVFKTILGDPANVLVTDINPIQILKQTEAVTYLGEGGRKRDVMNKESRRYHPTDMGVISEATVDSGDTGINTFLSGNPLFTGTRGIVGKYNFNEDKGTSLLSTSALLSPASIHDDAKRVNMVNIQQAHTVPAEGYRQPYIRTGYEYIIPQRLKNEFAYSADEDGVVESITDKGIIVKYKSNKRLGLVLGRTFGKSEGTTYPHSIVTLLKVKQSFKKGDVLAFNDGFFEEDILSPGSIILKNNMLATVALFEAPETWEDSSAISKNINQKLTTKVTKVKSIVIEFDQDLRNSVKVGDKVTALDPLVIIEDPITVKSHLFTDDAISTLKQINSKLPKAKLEGIIERIEVYYNGDKEDMSPGLLEITNKSDRELALQCKSTNKPIVTGRVTEEHRVEGVPLELDHAEIRYYITTTNDAGVGDKVVVANQLKSVIGKVMEYDMTTESGTPIDIVFGQKSIDARIVLSPEIMGTTATLLKLVAKEAVKLYNS